MDDAHDAEPEESPYIRLPWPLVAAALAGVLLLALGLGLYANRYLRPQVGVVPTPIAIALGAATAAPTPSAAPRPLALAAATQPPATVQLVTVPPAPVQPATVQPATVPPATLQAATAEPTPLQPTPSSAATPRATVSPELEAEVADAYQQYWQVRAEALYSLDTSRLQEVMAGDHLTAAEELIAQLRSEGRAIQTDVSHNYAVISATSDEAEIADEYTDDSFYVDMTSHQNLTEPLAGAVKEQYRMNKIDGTWRVVSLVRAP